MKKEVHKKKYIFHILLLGLVLAITQAAIYANSYNGTLESIIFYLINGAIYGDLLVYVDAVLTCLPYFIAILFILILLFYNVFNCKDKVIKIKNKKITIYPINIIRNHRKLFTIIYIVLTFIIVLCKLNVYDYVKGNLIKSNFIKDNYIIDKDKIVFNEKRNLIYIYVESLETTFFDKEHNGNWEYNVIPELYNLLEEDRSIYFSATSKVGGMSKQFGGDWTTAAIVSNSTGLPFKIPIQKNSYHSNDFMNGAYAIGDILQDNGYYNEFISGAVTSFGGLKEFFTKHGNYTIIDDDSLEQFGYEKKPADKGSWGMNDRYVFEVAKDRLTTISKNEQPFNLTIATIDTHPTDGFVGEYTLDKFDNQYENVYATEAKMLYNFVSWIKQQDFYENTTVIIVGDHLNMQSEFFEEDENRYIYNVIINSGLTTENTKNRIFTAVDMYPTTLCAIGANVQNNRMGLGTNLFSNKKTLAETYGLDKFNDYLEKKSDFYNSYILGLDYYEMLKEVDGKK